MPAGVDMVDGVVQAISVRVDAADRLGVKVAHKILVQDAARLGIVVAAVQVVKPDGSIIIIPAVAEGAPKKHLAFRLIQQIPPRVVFVLADKRAGCTFMILQNESLVNTPNTAKGAWISPCSPWTGTFS